MSLLRFSNKVILTLSVGQWRENGGRMVLCNYPGSTGPQGRDFLHQPPSVMMCRFRKALGIGTPGLEGQSHGQGSFLGWGLLSGAAEVHAHQAWKSCPESWSAWKLVHSFLSHSPSCSSDSHLCLLYTEEGTGQGCGWRVRPGLRPVGNLGSVVCGSWNFLF